VATTIRPASGVKATRKGSGSFGCGAAPGADDAMSRSRMTTVAVRFTWCFLFQSPL
jgi:hypothetical protein